MNTETLDALVQERIEADADFQSEIESLEDDERDEAIAKKSKEILADEWASLSDKAKKNEELANNYKTRAEKAEKGSKENKPAVEETTTSAKQDDLSTKDLYAVMNAKVHEDDLDEVVKAAKLLEKSIPEALKDTTVQAILEKRAEHRKTAEATSTRPSRAGAKKIDSDEILREASKGNIPDAGSAEAEELFWARRGGKRS